MDKSLETALRRELKAHARALGIPAGAASQIINEAIQATIQAIGTRSIITRADLTRIVTKELKKYHPDFAYIYKNYDIII